MMKMLSSFLLLFLTFPRVSFLVDLVKIGVFIFLQHGLIRSIALLFQFTSDYS